MSNLLKLNHNKTDVLILASPCYIHTSTGNVVYAGDVSVSSSQFVTNLDVVFDQTLSMKLIIHQATNY